MLCGAYFVVLFITNTIIVHVAPFAADLKLSGSLAAAMVSIIGGASIAGRLTMGLVSDKISCRRALLVCFILFVAAFSWLQAVNAAWALVLFTVVYGFAHGGFYAVMSPVVAEFFGTRAHGTIFGIVICIASMGGAIGPILTGRIFDNLASYQLAFLILLGLVVSGLVMTLLSGPPKKQTRALTGRGKSKPNVTLRAESQSPSKSAGDRPAAFGIFSHNDIHIFRGNTEFHEGIGNVFGKLAFLVRIIFFPHLYRNDCHGDLLKIIYLGALGPRLGLPHRGQFFTWLSFILKTCRRNTSTSILCHTNLPFHQITQVNITGTRPCL